MTDDSRGDVDSRDSVVGALKGIFAGLPRAPVGDDEADDPSAIGRYAVVRRVGSGAMGVVYAAYDEDLDRRVAIKLVRNPAARGPSAAARLRREAQALARISHPNVIGVHEVGEHGEHGDAQVFIAMEFVRGETLRRWCGAPGRSHREVLDVLLQAGRGLAAVHDAGLVHRDVKPENVMIGEDGRVRLMDFGLARGDAHEQLSSSDTIEPGTGDHAITRSGAIAGTPAYMAPEQFSGATVGAAADQFAFCVMAWEALYGARPFAGLSIDSLSEAVVSGRRIEPPRGSTVPTRVRRILERGLAVPPAERWPSMTALLDALARDSKRRLGLAVVGAMLVGSAIVAGTRTQVPDCRERADALAPWEDAQRLRVREAFTATGLPYAEGTAAQIESALDAYAQRLSSMQVDACEGTGVGLTPELRTAQELCLEHRRQGLVALVEVLTTSDREVVERAPQAVEALPSIEPCGDVAWLGARVRPPDDPQTAARVEEVRVELARVRALESAGVYDDALAAAETAYAEADALGYGPLIAEASLELGRRRSESGEYAAAEIALRDAYSAAVAGGDDETATHAATALVHTVGTKLERHDVALQWGWIASAALQRIGASPAAEARLLHHLGAVHSSRGAYDEAITEVRRAIELQERAFGEDGFALAGMLDDLGNAFRKRGDHEQALATYRRALELRERTLGPTHPGMGATLGGLAVLEFERGEFGRAIEAASQGLGILERALGPGHERVATIMSQLGVFQAANGDLEAGLALQRRALGILERELGPDHPRAATVLEYIANIHHARDELDEALPLYERVLAIRQKVHGAEHHQVAFTLDNLGQHYSEINEFARALEFFQRSLTLRERGLGSEHKLVAESLQNLGNAQSMLGNHNAAKASYTRCLELRIRVLGPEHDGVGMAHVNLGNVAEAQRNYPSAMTHFERALAIFEKARGPDHPRVALALFNLAQTRIAQGKPALGVPAAERALAIRERIGAAPLEVADARFILGQALYGAGRDRARARALVEQAGAAYRAVDHARELATQVDAWLRAHR